jgi:hypothetical protein
MKMKKEYLYALGMFVIMAVAACYYNQPKQFMTNTLNLPCVGCGCDNGWNGTCTDEIKSLCCENIPIIPEPTCAPDGQSLTCGGTCPDFYGWDGICTSYDTIYGFDCKCVYAKTR